MDHRSRVRARDDPWTALARDMHLRSRVASIRTLRGIVERPHTSACPHGCAELPSSTFLTMTAFLPA